MEKFKKAIMCAVFGYAKAYAENEGAPLLGFILCRQYRTVDGRMVDRLHLKYLFVEDTGSGYFSSH